MTFAEALAQLVAKVSLDRQAVVKLEALARLLRDNPGMEDILTQLLNRRDG